MSEQTHRKSPIAGLIITAVVVVLVYVLDHPLGALPAIGRLIDPVNGCWANAESVNKDFNANLKFRGLQQEATVWFDSLLVPHLHAGNDHDVYFIEGYIHAAFRLWQMDLQTRAAAGRVSEVIGEKALNFDRKQRLKGMGYAAENSLHAMEAEPRTKLMMDAYTDGINKYIATLGYKDYPIEYKRMGFAPEQWTNLKTALLLKYMADDLTGKSDDIAYSYLRHIGPEGTFENDFPDIFPGSTPVIPRGTPFDKPSLTIPTAPPDSVAFPECKIGLKNGHLYFEGEHETGKGSNNWSISGARTATGAPILCNDPHLGLNLPSLWFAIQLQSPGMNVYGVSLPGAPGVVIGFNDSLSWGVTNNYRDVKDYYLIKPVAENRNKYWFAGKQLDFSKRVERILVKGKPDVMDTIDYSIHGPVTYPSQTYSGIGVEKTLATCWMGHKGTNELLALYLLNRARNYNEFVNAILNFQCPAQNFAYADKAGNIAIWGQGQFVNKWKGQGAYIMNGTDSSTLWKELIPMRENPHALNPTQGYVSSANQTVTDSTYPYWYNGDFVELRAWRINQLLDSMHGITVQDMFAMQNDNYSILAAKTLPIMINLLMKLSPGDEQPYIRDLRNWDYTLGAGSIPGTIYQVWWYFFYRDVWEKPFADLPGNVMPLPERTMQLLTGADKWKPYRMAVRSYNEMLDSVKKLKGTVGIEWYNAKNTSATHLAKLPAFSYDHLKIGGWGNTINAAKGDHGPSWRMVVQMGKEIEAYGVYPGGQSGNPGSRYYANLLPYWTEGKYYKLLFLLNSADQKNEAIKYKWAISADK